jgi:hypothetical protein
VDWEAARPDYLILVGHHGELDVTADLTVRVAGEGWRAFASTGDAPPEFHVASRASHSGRTLRRVWLWTASTATPAARRLRAPA